MTPASSSYSLVNVALDGACKICAVGNRDNPNDPSELQFSLKYYPYEGTIYDRNGKPITFKDEYRVDFVTYRAEKFLRSQHEKPFLLFISQLEPHFQNDAKRFIAPNGAAQRFQDPFVPADLKAFPGNWQWQLPDYYGCCEAIDVSVGRMQTLLDAQGIPQAGGGAGRNLRS